MSQTVTLGGDRIGSGKKMKQELHDYGMTSFNLEQDFKSSMAPGVLYPFLKILGTNHDSFDIDLDSFVRTLPTQGPLFGSFKLQADLYLCPIRLYQGILHNNPVGIGLKMNQVFLPKIKYVTYDGVGTKYAVGTNKYNCQVNESALIKYLGISGAGHSATHTSDSSEIKRSFQCVPELAYYDIFKCYYSNKQEEKAYVISVVPSDPEEYTPTAYGLFNNWETSDELIGPFIIPLTQFSIEWSVNSPAVRPSDSNEIMKHVHVIITAYDNNSDTICEYDFTMSEWNRYARLVAGPGRTAADNYVFKYAGSSGTRMTEFVFDSDVVWTIMKDYFGNDFSNATTLGATYGISVDLGSSKWDDGKIVNDLQLVPFDLKNIDTMRCRLLSKNQLGQQFTIDDDTNLLPYSVLVAQDSNGISYNAYPMNGLVVKTYQSDLFNNWLDTEFIDGESGISNITAVAVEDGKFLLDSVNFAEKMYNLLNRILVSGGTYQDWQEARWGDGATRMAESPIFIGGMAAEVMFEEVISNSETLIEGDKQPLGSLGGKGTQVGKRGGNHIHVKCDEPSYIIGIVSLTPRICYSQGNDWDRTELDTLEDLHAPEMDGIGFQDLLVEQFAWWDTQLGPGDTITRHSAGKQTAWINYQTAVDKCYGDFAKQDGYSFMVLNRNYTMSDDEMSVDDVTTYIDPTKYNYAFAVSDLAAQNFWIQIHSNVVARRKMGAQQIPVL